MLPAGYSPFNGNDDREAHWAVAKDKCRFDKEDWKHTYQPGGRRLCPRDTTNANREEDDRLRGAVPSLDGRERWAQFRCCQE